MLEFVRILCCAEAKGRSVDAPKFRRLVERLVGELDGYVDDIIADLFRKADKKSVGKLTKAQIIALHKEKGLPEINMKPYDFNGDGKFSLAEFEAAWKIILDEQKVLNEVLVRQSIKAKIWTKEAWNCCVGPDDKYLTFAVFAELMAHAADISNVDMPEEAEVRAEIKNLKIDNNDKFTQDEFGQLFLTMLTRMVFSKEDPEEA
eukprot:TRINITY_DN78639_c0_g1_i1.p1 TRINITY_DN78639_c0_g1~~TRINITY_DN78639_c0_g1_i1.p1  ORF type:complete len:204 (+),score=54.04 TRINITY_DN78639_c0_g1_i1:84-695(+)